MILLPLFLSISLYGWNKYPESLMSITSLTLYIKRWPIPTYWYALNDSRNNVLLSGFGWNDGALSILEV